MHHIPEDDAKRRPEFVRLVRLVLVALPLPGLALVWAGRRRTGMAVLVVSVASAVAVAGFVGGRGVSHVAASLGADPNLLAATAAVVLAGGLAWALAIAVTAITAWPTALSRAQKLTGLALTVALCLSVAAPAAVLARYALISRAVTTQVFALHAPVRLDRVPVATPRPADARAPWAGTPRLNVLLLGLDVAPGRVGVRPDTIIVASIDTATGNTVLFGIPRNLEEVPFPKSSPLHDLWPRGFDCGSQCLINAIWTEAVNHADRFPRDPNPGLTATRSAVEAVLGLRVDYTVMVTLKGFRDLVDAVGGVEVTVKQWLPIGGSRDAAGRVTEYPKGYIRPGRQHLDGYHAQWFTRSRFSSSDFDRMSRQRYMIQALVDQVDPLTVVARFPAIAAATGRNLRTDIPLSDLPAWATLAERVRAGNLTSMPFTDKVINPARPDFPRIRWLVRRAIWDSGHYEVSPLKHASKARNP